MQEYVQKSISTTFHFNEAIVRGLELIHSVNKAGISGAGTGVSSDILGAFGSFCTVDPILVALSVNDCCCTGGKNLSNTPCSIIDTSNFSSEYASIFLSNPSRITSHMEARIRPSTFRKSHFSSA